MCRKWTASLIAQFIVVSPLQIHPPLHKNTSYKEFNSSPRRFRGFCSNCGTSLIWRSGDDERTVDLFMGTLDERWLVHEDKGDVGRVLATPNGMQCWLENAIPGVTNSVKGGEEYSQESTVGNQNVKT